MLWGMLPLSQAAAQGYTVGRDGSMPSVRAVSGDDPQRRKADLRAALQSQQASQSTQAARQLTQQDRAQLRQQLRQQRGDDLRP